jgi:Flp pilus assembly pilin Flp
MSVPHTCALRRYGAVIDQPRRSLMKTILGYLRDERGLETMEWIAIGALVLGVAFVIYPGVLQTALTTVVGNISTALTTGITLP